MMSVYKFFGAFIFYFYNCFVSYIPLYWVRHAYLRGLLGIKIGTKSSVHMGCFFTGRNTTIGDYTTINRKCYLDGRAGLRIGNSVNLSPESYLLSLSHDPQDPKFPAIGKETVIGDFVWLGARAMVMPGASVAEGCVVGAGSVVTRPTEPFTIVGGVPAKVIGERNRNVDYKSVYFPFFNTDITRPS